MPEPGLPKSEAAATQNSTEPITHPKWQDKILCWIEFGIVAIFSIGIIFSGLLAFIWILCGWPKEASLRASEIIKSLDSHWKLCLAVFIPMTFRPLRIFLENLESIWMAKRFPQQSGKTEQAPQQKN